ncbi:NAD(P)H-binding domain-containing protein [Sarocladium implicatum]|nr:NAD(P)H-binding domain-containing protein [Sarocladium implicatum]
MKFFVVGASGRTGQLVIDDALRKGHSVTALVRSASSIQPRENLTVVTGSPLDPSSLTSAFSSSGPIDAVIFTMASRRVSESPFAAPDPVNSPPRMMADSMKNVLVAMRDASPRATKIVAMSSVGTGESMENVNYLVRFMFSHTNMKYSRQDHDEVDKELKAAKDIVYVEARPWLLTDNEAAEVKVFPDNGLGAGFMPKISRASVASFLVDAAASSKYDGRSPVITN